MNNEIWYTIFEYVYEEEVVVYTYAYSFPMLGQKEIRGGDKRGRRRGRRGRRRRRGVEGGRGE